jgi:lipoprotein signal peptidase
MLLQSVLMFLLVGFSIWWVRGIIKGAPHAQLFACGLLLGGGWSNLMDRWTVGAVIDLFSLPFLGITNNLADWSICCGTLWFGWLKAKRLHRSHRI